MKKELLTTFGAVRLAAAARSVNIVNLVNLPRPCCICFVKSGRATRQMGYPLPMFTMFTKFILLFLTFFGLFLVSFLFGVRKICLVNPLFYELYELICIYRGSKENFCIRVDMKGVNFVNLVFFEVHRKYEFWGKES